MATVVDIANLALALLGDKATVASLDPPDGSAQASHCARFYPIARDALQERYPWGFAIKRVSLALVGETVAGWDYMYAQPDDMLNALAILDPDSPDDLSTPLYNMTTIYHFPIIGAGVYTPQQFKCETDPVTELPVILTNQQYATLVYSHTVTDPSRYSPLFIKALAYELASMLAGPLLKGSEGMQVAEAMSSKVEKFLADATQSDANQLRIDARQNTSWITARA